MSLQQGSFSLTRYRVVGRQKSLSLAELNQSFHGYQAAPISLTKSTFELRCGWTLPKNPEIEDSKAEQNYWDISDCLFEEGILLRFRIERKTVPTQLLQALVQQRWESLEQEHHDDNPARVQKKQIHEEVREELLQMALPSISYVDAYWKDQEDTILLFSLSKMSRECFEELFRKSFCQAHNLSIFRILPPLMGLESETWNQPGKEDELLHKLTMTLPGKNPSLSIS